MKSIDTQLFKVNMMNHSVNGRDVGELLKFIPTFILFEEFMELKS